MAIESFAETQKRLSARRKAVVLSTPPEVLAAIRSGKRVTGFDPQFGAKTFRTSDITSSYRAGLPSHQIRDPSGFIASKGTRRYSEIWKKMQAELIAKAKAAEIEGKIKETPLVVSEPVQVLDIKAPVVTVSPTKFIDVKKSVVPEEAGFVREWRVPTETEERIAFEEGRRYPEPFLSSERIEAAKRAEVGKTIMLGAAGATIISGGGAYAVGGLPGLAKFGAELGAGYLTSEFVSKESPAVLESVFPGKPSETYQIAGQALGVAGFIGGAGATRSAFKFAEGFSFKMPNVEVLKTGILPSGKTKVFTLHETPAGLWEYKPSPKPGIFDITGKEIVSTMKPTMPIKWQPSPMPGVFDLAGNIITPSTLAMSRPTTTAEALKWAKGIRKVSPLPGIFDVSGLPIETGISIYKMPVTGKEALKFAKGIRTISPKPGIWTLEGKKIKTDFDMIGMRQPVTAKEALQWAKGIKKVKTKRVTPFFKEPTELEIPTGRTYVVQKIKTVTKTKTKPTVVAHSYAIPGSYAQLSKALPAVVPKTVSVGVQKTVLSPKPFAEYAAIPSTFQKAGLTPIEKAIQKDVGISLKGRRRFSDYLGIGLSPAVVSAMGLKPGASVRQRRIELENYLRKQGERFYSKVVPRAKITGGVRHALIDAERELIKLSELPIQIPLQGLPDRVRYFEKDIQKQKITKKTKTKPKTRPWFDLKPQTITTEKQLQKYAQGFMPFVRRRGKWQPVLSQPTGRGTAQAFGASKAMETLARSFIVRPVSGRPVAMQPPRLPIDWMKQFRPAKSKALKGAFVERSLFALSQRGEKREIRAALYSPYARQKKKNRGGLF